MKPFISDRDCGDEQPEIMIRTGAGVMRTSCSMFEASVSTPKGAKTPMLFIRRYGNEMHYVRCGYKYIPEYHRIGRMQKTIPVGEFLRNKEIDFFRSENIFGFSRSSQRKEIVDFLTKDVFRKSPNDLSVRVEIV